MASTTSGSGSAAFTVLPVVGYALLAVVLAYLALRVLRYLKAARPSSSLPKPVSESKGKGFGFGRSTGWDWRRWSSLVPRVPSWSKAVPEMVKGKAKAVASAKNLSVELLPTTGLPPPPTSVPSTPPILKTTLQLVDLSTPPTPPLTTGATSASAFSSFPTSPRTPSPPFSMRPLNTMTSKPLFPSPALTHSSYPRPPSPHALLATTPPPSKPHRRSRSLGGVPVRRLSSGGRSGLRNAVELRDLSSSSATTNHTRGTSREHLLIDFTSSGSSDEEDDRDRYKEEEHVFKISPAASDIGVLPPAGKEIPPVVDARMVGRHVPLVDISDEVVDRHTDEDSWKWFSSGPVPSLSFSLGRGVRSLMDSTYVRPNKQQQASFSLAEKLVDVDGDDSAPLPLPELVSGSVQPVSVVVQRMEVNPQSQLVNLGDHKVGDKETPLVDLHEDDSHIGTQVFGSKDAKLVDIEDRPVTPEEPQVQVLSLPPPLPSTTPVFVKASFSHPLEDLVTVVVHTEHVLPLPQQPAPEREPIVISAKEDDEPGLLFAGSEPAPELEPQPSQHEEPISTQNIISPASADSDASFHYPLITQELVEPPSPLLIPSSHPDAESQDSSSQVAAGWSWDDLEDPWGNHVPEAEADSVTSVDVNVDVSTRDSEVFVYSGQDTAAALSESSEAAADEAEVEETQGSDLIKFEASTFATTEIESPAEIAAEADSPTIEDVLDKSPSGSLFATVLPDDVDDEEEVMPLLDLNGIVDVPQLEHEAETGQSLVVLGGEQGSMDEEEEEEATPKPTPASVKVELPVLTVDISAAEEFTEEVQVPVIVVQDSLDKPESELAAVASAEAFPDPDLLPLPASPLADAEVAALSPSKEDDCEPEEKTVPSQTPTPPASPPPISPLRFSANSRSRPPSPAALSAKLRLPPSPRLAVVVPPAQEKGEDKENETPTALSSSSSKPLWNVNGGEAPSLSSNPGLRRRVLVDVDAGSVAAVAVADEEKEEEKEEKEHSEEPQHVHAHGLKLSSSLPGSFPDSTSTLSISDSTSTSSGTSLSSSPSTTIAARLALAPAVLTPRPSARALARSPLDIALAMQLRPGLGAGADPAWMVRFLMAMFGWLAVVVSGGEQF